jgi:integrase
MKLTTNKASGRIYARLRSGNPAKPYVRLSLGTTSAAEAKQKAKAANLAKIESAMQAGQLSQQAIARLTVGHKLTTGQAAEQWIDGAEHRGESPSTTAKSRAVLSQWFDALPAVKALPPMAIAEEHIAPFVNRTDDAGAATRTRQLSVLRQFCRYLADLGLTQGNAARRVKVNHRALSHEQREKKIVQPFTEAEIKKLLRESGWWRWAVGLSSTTALRLGDVCQLEWACLTEPRHIVVWTDKRDRRICLPIDDKVTPGLAPILAEIPPNDTPYLFPEQKAQYDDIKTGRPKFSVYFGRLLESLGIEGKSFHGLRHTAISRWHRDGFDPETCKTYAGHTSDKAHEGYVHA